MEKNDISAMKALYGDGFVGEPRKTSKRGSIDFDGMTYEQLTELENTIVEKKKDFICIDFLFILERGGIPHLCYEEKTGGPYPTYDYNDIFDDLYVCGGFSSIVAPSLTEYLEANSIVFNTKYYNKDDLATLWESIRQEKIKAMLDYEQEQLDAKRRTLLPKEER